MNKNDKLESFAKLIINLQESDRDVNVGVAGATGEGKSTFDIQLLKTFYKLKGKEFDFDLMTWSRKELLMWIDGKPGTEKDPSTGLKPGQLPEYSGVMPDELFLMFYKRNWYDSDQIDGIATFNMCRDRHLFVLGNVPLIWDLDNAFLSRLRFYVYVPERGKAWVFMQENNPFSADPWNVSENRKLFRKKGNPYACPNFVAELTYDDLTPEEKERYLQVRNDKRVKAVQENKGERSLRYQAVVERFARTVRALGHSYYKDEEGVFKPYKVVEIAEIADVSHPYVSEIIAKSNTAD